MTIIVVLLLLILVAILLCCLMQKNGPGTIVATTEPGSDMSSQEPAAACLNVHIPETAISYESGDYYVPGEILLSGPKNMIREVVRAVNADHSNAIEVSDPENPLPVWSIDDLLPSYTDNFSIQQYNLATGVNVFEVQSWVAATAQGNGVYADPNYLISGPSDPLQGQSGGSPGIEGGPGGGSAGIEGAGGENPAAAPAYFLSQWAFTDGNTSKGINLFDEGAYTTDARGTGVKVAVFDSLPLGIPAGPYDTQKDVRGYPFTFCAVPALDTPIHDTPVIFAQAASVGSMNEHGYYVASLVHAVAPRSEIDLVQILAPDEDGGVIGSLGYLLQMMDVYLKSIPQEEANMKLVINLSLGFELPTNGDTSRLGEDKVLADQACNDMVDSYYSSHETPGQEKQQSAQLELDNLQLKEGVIANPAITPVPLPTESPTPSHVASGTTSIPLFSCDPSREVPNFALTFMTSHLTRQLGYLVVASAGNNWDGTNHQPDPLLPASLPDVLGVSAANFYGGESCFSNSGNVSAPGGDGHDPIPNGNMDCALDLSTQCDMRTPGCEYGIIGRVHNEEGEYDSGFAYWAGTSFSAPMASGLAALVWGTNPELTNLQVADLIMSCTTNGIIDVVRSVDAARSGLLTCPTSP